MLLMNFFKKVFDKDTTQFPLRKLMIDEIIRLNHKYTIKGFSGLNLTLYDDASWNSILRDATSYPKDMFDKIHVKPTAKRLYLAELNQWYGKNIYPIFLRWLKSESCYASYIQNTNNEQFKPFPRYGNVLKRPPCDYISSAFNWSEAKSLIDWFLIHTKWCDFLENQLNI
jgi:hypothetical protein